MKLTRFVTPAARRSAGALTTTAAMVIGLLMLGSPAGAGSAPAQGSLRATAATATVTTQYPVPAGALFVAPNGNDAAAGLAASPLKTVGSAVTKSTPGQTIVLRAGTYHESVVIPTNKKVTIQPYPGETVWFDGTSAVGQFTPAGGTFSAPWTVKFDASPTFSRGAYDGSDPGWAFLSPAYPMASHPDQVWIDGTPQAQVGSQAAVKPGTFYVDYPTGRMYLGTDPTGKEVRASDLNQAFLVVSDGTVLRGFGVRRYAPSVPDFGAVSVRRPNVVLENLDVSESSTIGISVIATNDTLRNDTVTGSGMLGVHANHADNIVLDNLQVNDNNTEHFNMSPVAGGLKITGTRGVTITGGSYSRNLGDGIWFDASVYDMKVLGADVQDNLGHGIEVEISAKFVIADNLVTGNGKIGILPRNSNDGRIWNNTLANNAISNINILQDSRTPENTSYGQDSRQPFPDPTMTWIISNIEIKNNINAKPAATATDALAMREETGKGANVMGANIDGNLYNRINPAAPATEFGWAVAGGSPLTYPTLNAYRTATGQDPHGYSIDGSDALDATFNLTPTAATAAAGAARPLPADIAAMISQPAGTTHLGAWTATTTPAAPPASFPSTTAGLVAAVRTDSGTAVFVHGTDDAVWFRSADPNQALATLGGRTVFGPAAASWGGNRLDLFVVGTDRHLYHKAGSFDGPWNGWEDLGGTLTASPAALSFAPGTLGVYARGADGQLWSISWTGTGWTSWSPKGGALTSGPGAVVDRDSGQATVGVRGTDGTLWELRFGSEGPGGYTSVGTAVSSAPAYAARLGDGDRRIVAFRSSDGCVSVGGTPIGGIVTSAPALVLDPTGSGVSAFVRGNDDALWVYRGVPGSGSWSTLGGQLG